MYWNDQTQGNPDQGFPFQGSLSKQYLRANVFNFGRISRRQKSTVSKSATMEPVGKERVTKCVSVPFGCHNGNCSTEGEIQRSDAFTNRTHEEWHEKEWVETGSNRLSSNRTLSRRTETWESVGKWEKQTDKMRKVRVSLIRRDIVSRVCHRVSHCGEGEEGQERISGSQSRKSENRVIGARTAGSREWCSGRD